MTLSVRLFKVTIAVGAVLGLTLAGAASAAAAWKVQPSPNRGGSSTYNVLNGVAAISSTNVWAVGYSYHGTAPYRTLAEHWNGKAWKVVSSPSPAGSSLKGVAATSSTNAWAVGYSTKKGDATEPLIVHWNGKAWKVVPSPNPGSASGGSFLAAVAATSSTNAWAVGSYEVGSLQNGWVGRTLVEHWNGTAWTVVPSPNGARTDNMLNAVSATSSTNAWAVGYASKGTANRTLVEHWDGTAWTVVPSPNPAGSSHDNELYGVAATSSTNAWLVGDYDRGASPYRTLVEHWNGTAWNALSSPNPRYAGGPSQDFLYGVAAISSTNAWAVGYHDKGLVEHWNGNAWKVVPSPNPAGSSLNGVAATSSRNAWAVGQYWDGTADRTLIEHWNSKPKAPAKGGGVKNRSRGSQVPAGPRSGLGNG